MDRRTRVVVFDGGLLEVADYEDTYDDGAVYLELRTLPQRVPGAAEIDPPGSPFEPADAELSGRVLRLLRDLP
ncbi:hypothetical protein OHA40_08665 [Nocardia sp. NBC_00508]|uniref:hypothetical protein n=1 Tax=Nocardia sp. NBC_00508 TaxID=2975992 RepID=UPI002E7FEEC8|nr:hypothetical protein [Nocardia sp. NBC_00508]WUD68173.1 hypothetical protein OHA40_08665 [Nocardia sp. NBC_00508]